MVAIKKTKYEKYKGRESDMQKAVARYLDYNNVLWFHTPNEIKANPQYGKKRKQQGVKAGVPDITILEPKGNYNGLFIELKVGYNKPSTAQLKWLEALKNKGYKAVWTCLLDQAIDIINQYLNLK